MSLHDILPEKTYPSIPDVAQRAIVNFQQTYLGKHTIAVNRKGVVYYRDRTALQYRGMEALVEFVPRDLKFWSVDHPQYDHIPFDWNMIEILDDVITTF